RIVVRKHVVETGFKTRKAAAGFNLSVSYVFRAEFGQLSHKFTLFVIELGWSGDVQHDLHVATAAALETMGPQALHGDHMARLSTGFNGECFFTVKGFNFNLRTQRRSSHRDGHCCMEVIAFTREDIVITNADFRSDEHTTELQSRFDIVCRLLIETKK